MRKLLVASAIIIAGCAVTLPAGDKFSTAMLERGSDEEALLFVYSMPDNWSAFYKHILVDGVHQSTITNDTFARLVVSAGEHAVRISQHGFKNQVEIPLGLSPNPAVSAESDGMKDIEVALGSVNFLAVHRKKRTVYYECDETATEIKICSREVTGVVIEEPSRETALSMLSSLHEVCDECE